MYQIQVSPEFPGHLNNRLKEKRIYIFGPKLIENMIYDNKNLGMTGFGTWSITLEILVYHHENKFLQCILIKEGEVKRKDRDLWYSET